MSPNDPPRDSIYLYIAPLESSQGLFSTLVPRELFKPSARILPQFYHWAIVVRGRCYEVASSETGHTMYIQSLETWKYRRNLTSQLLIKLKLGLTRDRDRDIEDKAKHIWKDRLDTTYKLFSQNCQNFAYNLYKRIRLDRNSSSITAAERATFSPFPKRLTHLKEFATFGIVIGASLAVYKMVVTSEDKKWLKRADSSYPSHIRSTYQGYDREMIHDLAEELRFGSEDIVFVLQSFDIDDEDGGYLEFSAEEKSNFTRKLTSLRYVYRGFHKRTVQHLAEELDYCPGDIAIALERLGFSTNNGQEQYFTEHQVDKILDELEEAEYRQYDSELTARFEDYPVGYVLDVFEKLKVPKGRKVSNPLLIAKIRDELYELGF